MINLLSDYLEYRKIKRPDQLKTDEQATYNYWRKILEKEIKVEDIIKFIQSEIERIEENWLEEKSKNPITYFFIWKKEIEMKARLKNYKALLGLIKAEDRQKESVVRRIKKLLK